MWKYILEIILCIGVIFIMFEVIKKFFQHVDLNYKIQLMYQESEQFKKETEKKNEELLSEYQALYQQHQDTMNTVTKVMDDSDKSITEIVQISQELSNQVSFFYSKFQSICDLLQEETISKDALQLFVHDIQQDIDQQRDWNIQRTEKLHKLQREARKSFERYHRNGPSLGDSFER